MPPLNGGMPRKPGPATFRVETQGGLTAMSRRNVGEEDRSAFSVPEEAWKEPGGLRLPADQLGRSTLADDHGAAVGEVQVLDVQSEDLVCSGGGFVEEPPEGLLT